MATIRDCTKIQPLLSEYVDGTLADQVSWDVKMHITSCAVCAKIADDFTATSRLLGELPQMELSANFEAMLTKRLADEALRPYPLTPWTRLKNTLSELWQNTARRNIMATGVAVAMMVPLAVVVMNRSFPGNDATHIAVVASPTPVVGTPEATEAPSLDPDQVWSGHLSYSASGPLGDPSGLLATNGGGM
jgi:anti-sigma factor RsiW